MKDHGRVSLSIGCFQNMFGDRRALEIAAEIGAEGVDFDLSNPKRWNCLAEDSIYHKSDEEIVAYGKQLRQYADELGIAICQTHGRGEAIHNNEKFDRIQFENMRRDCLMTAALGAPVCIIHAVPTIAFPLDVDKQVMRDANFRLFTTVVGYARQYGIRVATETFGDAPPYDQLDFFGDIREFLMSYNRVAAVPGLAEHFTVCVDTGHSNKASRFGDPTPGDVIRMLGDRVTVLHLNDNDTLTDQHKVPTTGCIDWNDVFDALDEIGYAGDYNMELHLSRISPEFAIEEAAYAVKVLKEILRLRAEGKRIG